MFSWKKKKVDTKINNLLTEQHFHGCICRKALANALATAPSMWILGNAGMGALQVIM